MSLSIKTFLPSIIKKLQMEFAKSLNLQPNKSKSVSNFFQTSIKPALKICLSSLDLNSNYNWHVELA